MGTVIDVIANSDDQAKTQGADAHQTTLTLPQSSTRHLANNLFTNSSPKKSSKPFPVSFSEASMNTTELRDADHWANQLSLHHLIVLSITTLAHTLVFVVAQ